MGDMQLPDALLRVVERAVEDGLASSPAAFVEEAILRLIVDAGAEEADIRAAVAAGTADIATGRYRTVTAAEDTQRLHDELMADLRGRLSTGR